MSLDQKIQQEKRQIPLRERIAGIINYVAPFMNSYNAEEDTDILLQDQDIQKLMQDSGITREQLTPYLNSSRQQYRALLNTAVFADTTDRLSSLIGIIAETITAPGIAPPFALNGIEETAEMLTKLPFYYLLNKTDKSKISPLLWTEFGTALTPIAGDVYDILTHKYMVTAKQVIRERAKEKILQDHYGILSISCPCSAHMVTASQHELPSVNGFANGASPANPTKPL